MIMIKKFFINEMLINLNVVSEKIIVNIPIKKILNLNLLYLLSSFGINIKVKVIKIKIGDRKSVV